MSFSSYIAFQNNDQANISYSIHNPISITGLPSATPFTTLAASVTLEAGTYLLSGQIEIVCATGKITSYEVKLVESSGASTTYGLANKNYVSGSENVTNEVAPLNRYLVILTPTTFNITTNVVTTTGTWGLSKPTGEELAQYFIIVKLA